VVELAALLGWNTAKTQKEIYLNGGGIVANSSTVGFTAARALLRSTGLDARFEDPIKQTVCGHCQAEIQPDVHAGEAPLWKKRAGYWLKLALSHFSISGDVELETAALLMDTALTQLILGEKYGQLDEASPDTPFALETTRIEWKEILSRFTLPGGKRPDAMEIAFLNDMHAARNDIIHGILPSLVLSKDSVYIWLFLSLALATQLGAIDIDDMAELYPFLPATSLADDTVRQGCVRWLVEFVPALLEPVLGKISIRLNMDGKLGIADDQRRAFLPDLVFEDKNGLRYSAQVEIPTTINFQTAQYWAYYTPSLVFVPLGYLAHARYLARLAGYPEANLMAYISPTLEMK